MRRKILVLAVDRDDDLGRVGIKTPIVGDEGILNAAVKFGLERPEDPDLNVLYAALNTAQSLRRRGYEVIVAAVSGDPYDPIRADMRIREQVEHIVKSEGVEGIVIVADGREDEQVIPIIETLAPILSVRRVVVEQFRGLEETYILVGRYIKKALVEPRFAKVFLGYPGIIVTSFAVLALLGLLHIAFLALLLVAGVLMIVRGFGFEEKIVAVWTQSPILALGVLIMLVSIAAALGIAYYTIQAGVEKTGFKLVADMLSATAPLVGLGGIGFIASRIAHKLLAGNVNVFSELTGLTGVIVAVLAMVELSSALRGLPQQPSPTEVALAIASSGVLPTLLAGLAITALIRVLSNAVTHRISSHA